MQLKWIKCQGSVWCKLNSVNLDHEHFKNMHGVYIIWHGGTTPRVVCLGQGHIKECLTKHRSNPQIQRYDNLDLYVTWAAVPEEHRNGVKSYLANSWNPIVPVPPQQTSSPITVNSPWQ